ncbi:heme exporter protein CcmD [Ruegeria faecimaris]|uniref:Heme exporter protein D n=1 Tax=Ruegeria faecimaris TaxID=686389 RepID=A0A521AK05_9RHOB|nr:heme exporter protein CcmD [Ruegeria faecimaris]SMO35165.1 heme exporter protein D [Ruegeria faecimaris]
MIPDLGKYADTVLWSYVVSIGLLLALVLVSVMRGRKSQAELEKVEQRIKRNG